MKRVGISSIFLLALVGVGYFAWLAPDAGMSTRSRDAGDQIVMPARSADHRTGPSGIHILATAISPGGERIAGVLADGRIVTWDRNGGARMELSAVAAQPPTTLAFSADGQTLVAGSSDSQAYVWSLETQDLLNTLRGHVSKLSAVSIGPTLIATSADETRILLWSRASGRLTGALRGHTDFVRDLDMNASGDLLASVGADGRILIWDLERQQIRWTLAADETDASAIRFSPDGRRVLSASPSGFCIWELQRGTQEYRSSVAQLNPASMVFNADGSVVAGVTGGNRIVVWDAADGLPLNEFTPGDIVTTRLAYRADGELLVAGRDSRVQNWDALTGHQVDAPTRLN